MSVYVSKHSYIDMHATFVSEDPSETTDLSKELPAVLELMYNIFLSLKKEEVPPVFETPMVRDPRADPTLQDNTIFPGWCEDHVQGA